MEKSLEFRTTKGLNTEDYAHFNELYSAVSVGASRASANLLPDSRMNSFSDAI